MATPPSDETIERRRAIVHIHHPAPGDAAAVEAQRIAPVDVIVEEGGEQIVAVPMAWKSPVKCRLMSSIGTTWA